MSTLLVKLHRGLNHEGGFWKAQVQGSFVRSCLGKGPSAACQWRRGADEQKWAFAGSPGLKHGPLSLPESFVVLSSVLKHVFGHNACDPMSLTPCLS